MIDGPVPQQPGTHPSKDREATTAWRRRVIRLLWVGVLVLSMAPMPAGSQDRRAAHDEATEEFRRLHFFAEGDGMHLSPGLVKWIPRASSLGEKTDDPALMRLLKQLDELDSLLSGGNPLTALRGLLGTLGDTLSALLLAVGTSTGIDRPLIGASDELVGDVYRRRWGVNYEQGKPVGLFKVKYEGMKIGTLGCVACHSGRAAGEFIVGLGNKNVDTWQIGRDAYLVEKVWKLLPHDGEGSDEYERVEASAIEFADLLRNKERSNLTQGMVPVMVIRDWFYRQADERPDVMARGAVKVPALWGYGQKRGAGQFCDGFGDGLKPGWAVAVELVAGQKPEVIRSLEKKIEEAEALFSDFLPPPYPKTIDGERAAQGKIVFEANCQRCHGTYEVDDGGHPVYKAPNPIPWDEVRTDEDRLEGNTPKFRQLVASSPLADLVKARDDGGKGYFAPRLVGIWARYPYLHNGSVPSIRALLTPAAQRPTSFSLLDAGEDYRFDPDTLGLNTASPSEPVVYADSERYSYDTNRVGHSNRGHPFGTKLPEQSKRNLIEYLKTL